MSTCVTVARLSLQGVVAPIARNLRTELSAPTTCKNLEGFILSWINDAVVAEFPGEKHLDRLEWAGAWAGMLSCAQAAAGSVIVCLTSNDRNKKPGEHAYFSPILFTMLSALREDDALPLRAKRFDGLHAELIELAADSLKAMRPELKAKADSYITALHLQAIMSGKGNGPSRW